MGIVEVSDQAVGTSGTYSTAFEQDGRIYHEFLDPTTGYLAQTGVVQATVVSNSAVWSALLSNALMVMDPASGVELADTLPDVAAVITTEDRTVHLSDRGRDIFLLVDERFRVDSD